MKAREGRGLFCLLMGALGLLMVPFTAATAASADGSRQVAVTLSAGESYTIKDISQSSTPGVHVIENPNALIVHGDVPGQLVVLGTSPGQWNINVETTAGDSVTY